MTFIFTFFTLKFGFHTPFSIAPNVIVSKYLRLCKPLYYCRENITDVMSALQIHLFLQNKAKFRRVKLNVNKVLTRDYEQIDNWSSVKKQSQTKPTCHGVAYGEAGTNPTCRGVAYGEAGTNPISKAKQ